LDLRDVDVCEAKFGSQKKGKPAGRGRTRGEANGVRYYLAKGPRRQEGAEAMSWEAVFVSAKGWH
jgi:hypothetical protein